MEESSIPLDKVCLLDPKAEKELAPEDGDGRFEWFLFGVNAVHSVYLLSSKDGTREFWVGCPIVKHRFTAQTSDLQGDDPPRDRTSELRKLGFPTRHLGPVQMTTDTALGVTKKVVQDGSTYTTSICLSQSAHCT